MSPLLSGHVMLNSIQHLLKNDGCYGSGDSLFFPLVLSASIRPPVSPHSALFFLSDSTEPEDVLSALGDRLRLDVGEPVVCTRRYLDTFDWRLYRAETVLFLETGGGRRRLWWMRRGDGTVLHQRPARGAPRRPDDLPEGPFREALGAAVGVREGTLLLFRAWLRHSETMRRPMWDTGVRS